MSKIGSNSPQFRKVRTAVGARLRSMEGQLNGDLTTVATVALGHGFELRLENSRIPAFRGAPARIKPEAQLFVDGLQKVVCRGSNGYPDTILDASTRITRYLLEHGFNPEVLG